MIVGTAGHIDHGKTSLVKALTGVDTDRLKEEKARGITIELGFAYVPLPGGDILGFVDVPGHERFVHTMLAGSTGIDFALLVVAADDGVMPQTREHLDILDMLAVPDGIVALTKSDLVDEAAAELAEAEIREALAGTRLAGADIYRVSSVSGAGVDEIRQRLEDEALSRPTEPRGGLFRMAIDRSFSLQGTGTVVTGTALTGSIATGDQVTILPSGLSARVRSIHAQGRHVDRGVAGQRCALNLAGSGISKEAIARGDWVVVPQGAGQSLRFDAEVSLLRAETRPLKTWAPVYLHLGTSALASRLVLLSDDLLVAGGNALAQVVLPSALPVRHGDLFVLRAIGADRTVGGGRVLDPDPPARRRRTPERLAALQALRAADLRSALAGLLETPPCIAALDRLAAAWGLEPAEADASLPEDQLVTVATAQGRFLTSAANAARIAEAITAILTPFHAAHPEQPGMAQAKLRLALEPRLSPPHFEAVLVALDERGDIVRQASLVRLPGHTSSLGAQDLNLWSKVKPMIAAEPYRPPTARDIGLAIAHPVANVRRLCKTLARMGELTEVATDRFFLRTSLQELGEMARELSQRPQAEQFTAAEFRDRAGCGRNVAIQILEYFDRHGITLRHGDLRRLGKDPSTILAGRQREGRQA